MNKLRTIIILVVLAIAILIATVVPALARKVNEYEGQHIASVGDPSQWG